MALLPTRRDERSVEQWDPFAELEDVRREMERVFEEFMNRAPMAPRGDTWSPRVDIEETEDAWIVDADLPGAKRDDITVELQGDELAVHGEIKERERMGVLRRRTRMTGRFDFRVRLPGEIDEEALEAKLDDGVLTIHVPKSERTRRRRIEVKTG
jgi:HSP20 family protein